MLNDDDVKQLNKLLRVVKTSDDVGHVEISYSKTRGWRVGVWPEVLDLGEDYDCGDYEFKKTRLGQLCLDKIVFLVQKKLGG